MSDLLTDNDLAPERETVREPAKRWRNWYRVSECVELETPSGVRDFGPGRFSIGDYPSKEIAEQAAIDDAVRNGSEWDCITYLGAYPKGERP